MRDRTCFNNSSRRVHVARLFYFHDVFVCQIECVFVCFAFSPDAIWIGVGLPRRSPFLPSIDDDFRETWSCRTSTPMHCPSSLSFLFGGKCSFTFLGFYCLSFWIGGEETSEVIWFQVVRIGFVCAAKWPNLAGLIGRRGNAMWLVWTKWLPLSYYRWVFDWCITIKSLALFVHSHQKVIHNLSNSVITIIYFLAAGNFILLLLMVTDWAIDWLIDFQIKYVDWLNEWLIAWFVFLKLPFCHFAEFTSFGSRIF